MFRSIAGSITLLAAFSFAAGCNCGRRPLIAGGDAGVDGGRMDGGQADAGGDGGFADGGPRDGGLADGGPDGGFDGGALDGGPIDGGSADAGALDGGQDGGPIDAGQSDGGSPLDGGSLDGGRDAGPVLPAPVIGSILPGTGNRNLIVAVTVSGVNLSAAGGAARLLFSAAQGNFAASNVAVVSANELTATVGVDATRPLGVYNVTEVNGDGQSSNTLPFAFTVTDLPPPTVTNVQPTSAWTELDQIVTVTGTNFVSTPSVRFQLSSASDAGVGSFLAASVAYDSPTQLSAVVPSASDGMPAGQYQLFVDNPDRQEGEWLASGSPGIFYVTTIPPPRISAISPTRAPAASTISFVVRGLYFRPDAHLDFLDATTGAVSVTFASGSLAFSCGGATCAAGQTADTIAISIPGATFTSGAIYPVRVVNPADVGSPPSGFAPNPVDQSDTYYVFEATASSAGHFTAPWLNATSELNVPRWKHGAAVIRDDFDVPYLYVAGGESCPSPSVITNGAASCTNPIPTASVEYLPGDLLGQFSSPNGLALFPQQLAFDASGKPLRATVSLNVPRRGLQLVRVGQWLYAVGGDDGTLSLSSYERARLLSTNQAPIMDKPSFSTLSGELPFGSWYYEVTARSADGESLASQEAILVGISGTAIIRWSPIAGAVAYEVYRSLAVDGVAGSEELLAWDLPPAPTGQVNQFNDDGAGPRTPAPGHLRWLAEAAGTLAAGNYSYRVAATTPFGSTVGSYPQTATLSATGSVELDWDASAGATGYTVYRQDPASQTYCLLASAVSATTFSDLGSLSPNCAKPLVESLVPLQRGAIGYFQLGSGANSAMAYTREGLGSLKLDIGSAGAPPTVMLWAVGGDGHPTSGGTDAPLATVERAIVDTGPSALCGSCTGTGALIWQAHVASDDLNGTGASQCAAATCESRGYPAVVTTQPDLDLTTPTPSPTSSPPQTVGCGLSQGAVAVIEITPQTASIDVGQSQAYSAVAFDANGCLLSGIVYSWSVSSAGDAGSVATIDPSSGVATGTAAGTATVTAQSGGVTSNNATLTVSGGSGSCTLASMTIAPASATITLGQSQAYALTAATESCTSCADGGSSDSGSCTVALSGSEIAALSVSWSSSNGAATISGSSAGASATGVAAGTATITATANGIVSNGASLVVTSGSCTPPTYVLLIPGSSNLTLGGTETFLAEAYNAQGQLISGDTVVWQSNNSSVVTVTQGGVATATGIGTAGVTATVCGVVSNTGLVTVSSAKICSLASLSICYQSGTSCLQSPANIGLPGTLGFIASATDSCGTNVTSTITFNWASSVPTVAAIQAGSPTSVATLTAQGSGTTNVTATAGGLTSNAVSVNVAAFFAVPSTPIYLYAVSGVGTGGVVSDVLYTAVDPNQGTLGPSPAGGTIWSATGTPHANSAGVGALLYSAYTGTDSYDYLFMIGGAGSVTPTNVSPATQASRFVVSSTDGSLGSWQSANQGLNTAVAFYPALLLPPEVYAIGGGSLGNGTLTVYSILQETQE